jgi:L-alanine-DL-glutamate epimerase-like enolase superfamily enzyme
MIQAKRIEAFVCRAPIATPVQTSFGIMFDRPALFVRVTDADDVQGWGEVWCNFPSVGAEHRARLIESVFAPLLLGKVFAAPSDAFDALVRQTEVLAIQCAEPGPIAQCIAGLDIALWDLYARRLGQPLWRLLGGKRPQVRVYASGLNPQAPELLAADRLGQGDRAFKLKVGFDRQRDLANLQVLRKTVGACALMVDANQAWDLTTALEMAQRMAPFELQWIEEPLRADQPWNIWQALAQRSSVALAAGENIAGVEAFAQALQAKAIGVVQPDIAKWGGFSGGVLVAKSILEAGLRWCPHYLGGGVGLLASAHLLAAIGGDGMLEVDANPNPLRSMTCGSLNAVVEGYVSLGEAPGLGYTPDLQALREFRRNF